MKLACVIGAGLYGSQIATALEGRGYTVVIIDDKRPLAGSAAAACLVKAEWVRPLGAAVIDPAFEWLNGHYKRYVPGWVIGDNQIKGAFYYEPSEILRKDVVEATVVNVLPNGYGGTVVVDVDNPDHIPNPEFVIGHRGGSFEVKTTFDVVVVAAGVWTPELLKHIPHHGVRVSGKVGSAILWRGSLPVPSFVHPWAPYKQIVGLQRSKDYWLGDGSALLLKSYTQERKQQSLNRCVNAILTYSPQVAFPDHVIDGIRPYTDDIHGICRQVHPGIWVATGARKAGTVLGAYCAQKIAKEVP